MPSSGPLFAAFPFWQIAFWATYAAWTVMEFWIVSRDRRRASGERRDRGSRPLITYLVFAGLFGAFFAAYLSPVTAIPVRSEAMFWSAMGLIWAGMALRLWAVRTLGRFFRTTVFVQNDHQLITAGPYAVLRNPSYTGSLVSAVGIGLAMGNWLSLALTAGALLAAYARRIPLEEQALAERFGDAWTRYRQGRWALIPPVW